MIFSIFTKEKELISSVNCNTFWDFFDDRDQYISGARFVKWRDSDNMYVFDLCKDSVYYSTKQKPDKFKIWTTYAAFKMPVEQCDSDDIL